MTTSQLKLTIRNDHLLNMAVLMVSFMPEFAEQAASFSCVHQTDIRALINPVAEFLLACSHFSSSTYFMYTPKPSTNSLF